MTKVSKSLINTCSIVPPYIAPRPSLRRTSACRLYDSTRDEHAALLASGLCTWPRSGTRSPFSYSPPRSTDREAACAAARRLVGSPATFLRPALISPLIGNGEGRACLRVNAQIFLFLHSPGTRASVHTYVDRQDAQKRNCMSDIPAARDHVFKRKYLSTGHASEARRTAAYRRPCVQASPASRRVACARRARAHEAPRCEVLTRFPRPLTLPAPFGLTVLRTYARTRRRSSRPSST